MATNHGVGGSNPSSPTTSPIGSLPFDGRKAGSSNYDWRSGRKAMELGPFSTKV